MSYTNINYKKQGFTIVELLIVVVVIAILAAITIVSYNGITNRANASSARSTANSLQKKIEAYAAEEGRYVAGKNELTAANKAYTVDSAIFNNSSGTVDPTSGGTTNKGTGYVRVRSCHTGSLSTTTVTGNQIRWYNYEGGSIATITVGDCSGTVSNMPATAV